MPDPAIDIYREDLIDLREAAKLPPFKRAGRAAHVATLYRHAQHGAKAANGARVRLEVVRVPSGLRTSREAVVRFISALSGTGRPLPRPATEQRQKQIAQAEAELAADGFRLAN